MFDQPPHPLFRPRLAVRNLVTPELPTTVAPAPLAVVAHLVFEDGSDGDYAGRAKAWTREAVLVELAPCPSKQSLVWISAADVSRPAAGHGSAPGTE